MAQTDTQQTDRPALYLIRHVNFGSGDGTPSSKFKYDFSCDNYAQARAIFNLVAAYTKYKPSKLILSHKHTEHLSQVSVPYMGDVHDLLGASPAHKDQKGSAKGAFLDGLKGQSVTVHRGRTSGFKGTATGYGYLASIPTTAKRVFLFRNDETRIGPDTAMKYELMLEVMVGPDSKWYSGKYVDLLDYQSKTAVLLDGIIETLKQYVVKCPYCASQSNDCFVEKLVREIEVESCCTKCRRSFFVTLFE